MGRLLQTRSIHYNNTSRNYECRDTNICIKSLHKYTMSIVTGRYLLLFTPFYFGRCIIFVTFLLMITFWSNTYKFNLRLKSVISFFFTEILRKRKKNSCKCRRSFHDGWVILQLISTTWERPAFSKGELLITFTLSFMTSSLPSPRTIEGIHWSDLMSNEELRRKTDQPDIVSIITRCRVLVIGHVLRRPDVHPTVVIYQVDLQFANQRGPHGRPRIHWKDVSRQDFQYINLALEGVPALCWRDKMALVISRHS